MRIQPDINAHPAATEFLHDAVLRWSIGSYARMLWRQPAQVNKGRGGWPYFQKVAECSLGEPFGRGPSDSSFFHWANFCLIIGRVCACFLTSSANHSARKD